MGSSSHRIQAPRDACLNSAVSLPAVIWHLLFFRLLVGPPGKASSETKKRGPKAPNVSCETVSARVKRSAE